MGLMPRPYPRSLADHPRGEPSFLSFLLYLRSSSCPLPPPSPPPFPHRALTLHRLNPRRLRARTPVLRRLKHAVDKKQVCRAKRGAHVRQEGARRQGAISGGGRRGVNDRGGKRSSREPVSFPFFLLLLSLSLSLPRRLLHLSVRFHSRQLGIFRPTLDIVFAASRVSFSLEIPSAWRRDGLSTSSTLFHPLPDRDVTKLARIRSRIQLVSYVPFYIIRIN